MGYRTARVVQGEGHEVTVIDRDPDRTARARTGEFPVVEGDGSREELLIEASVEEADAVGALTGDLNTNFAVCLIAHHHGCRAVMRVNEDYREGIYQRYAEEADEIVYPERPGAIGAKNALVGGGIRAIADVAEQLQVVVFTVTPESPTRGYSPSEVSLPADTRITAFGKRDQPMGLPVPDDALEAGDRVTVLADFGVLSDVRRLLTGGHDPAAVSRGGA